MTQLQIGFLIYPGVIQLDFTGPYQVLSFPPNTEVHLVWKNLMPMKSNEGLVLTPTTTFADCPPFDVICVPGGGLGQLDVMKNNKALAFLKQQAGTAQYVTSVCTGFYNTGRSRRTERLQSDLPLGVSRPASRPRCRSRSAASRR